MSDTEVSSNNVTAPSSRLLQRVTSPPRYEVVGAVVFLASLFGILTRPVGFLAAFWPANAILLGMLVRHPRLATPAGWLSATAGYLAADFVTGGEWRMTLWLTAGNLAGAMTGVLLFRQLSEDDRNLRRPLSMLYLFAICAATGVAAAVVGGGAGPVLIGKDWSTSCVFWLVTELVNSILLLPVILTAPPLSAIGGELVRASAAIKQNQMTAVPVLALLISMIGSILLGGPGTMMFAVPALLWCALSYDLFPTSLLTLLYCFWMLVAVSAGSLVIQPDSDYILETLSIRMGISLLALGPLTAASINRARMELLQNLHHAVNHDFLTDALARRAFMTLGTIAVGQPDDGSQHPAILMMDIDHFKRVNDSYGHEVGDLVLVEFAKAISGQLRHGDLFGRLGGEEFSAILPGVTREQAESVAERLRDKIERTPIITPSGERLQITVSIGLAYPEQFPAPALELMLSKADQALYCSKQAGRNRVTTVAI